MSSSAACAFVQDAVIPNTGSESQARGQAILEAHNPNMTPEAKANGARWFDGLQGENCRFVPCEWATSEFVRFLFPTAFLCMRWHDHSLSYLLLSVF